MKHLALVILLALAPLSWGYTFDDGTVFKGPVTSYTYLECKWLAEDNSTLYRKEPNYRKFYAIFVERKHAYSVNSETKTWTSLKTRVEDNRISFTKNPNYGWSHLDRTTLEVRERTQNLACLLTDHKSVDAWLKRVRAERLI